MLRGWNHINGDSLAGRKVLYLHLPVTATAGAETATRRVAHGAPGTHHQVTQTTASKAAIVKRHKVKEGETLYSIASSYNTTVTALKHDNQNVASLRPGMILIIRPLR
jgi:LysM repeat protein